MQRLRARGPTTSDADQNIARRLAGDADPWPEATPLPTGGAKAASLTRAVAVLAETGPR